LILKDYSSIFSRNKKSSLLWGLLSIKQNNEKYDFKDAEVVKAKLF
jgi:hypothetical protein